MKLTVWISMYARWSYAGDVGCVKIGNQQSELTYQSAEIAKYKEKVHHIADQNIELDLDDGVKKNYEIFADMVAKIS